MLLIGYGNPGRGDDGLGPALSERFKEKHLPGLDVDTDYQLTAEHALAIAAHDLVVFADAEIGGAGAFSFKEIEPAPPASLASHSFAPHTVLSLGETLFSARPRAFVLGISGYDYGEVKEGLTPKAVLNLADAEAFLLSWIERKCPSMEAGHA